MHVEMTYSNCPSVFDSNDYYVLTYAITPHTKPSSGIKSQDWAWPLSSVVFSALVSSCGDLWWRQFRVVEADASCGANSNDQ